MRMLRLKLAALLLLLILPVYQATARETGSQTQREEIITLVEQVLSRAYTFTRPGQLPDFSTLDRVYPGWDQGDPGGARRKWQSGDYLYYRVKFRVDSVFMTSPYTARVRGKKSVNWARRVSFLWWFHRTKDNQRHVHFVAQLYRDAQGRWLVKSLTEM